jgi:hypothetical protein
MCSTREANVRVSSMRHNKIPIPSSPWHPIQGTHHCMVSQKRPPKVKKMFSWKATLPSRLLVIHVLGSWLRVCMG